MRFLGSWWERARNSRFAPTLVAALALGLTLSRSGHLLRLFFGPASNYWN